MKITALVVTCLLFLACGDVDNRPEGRFPYTLKDFSPKLRGPLQKIITNGLFNDDIRDIEDTLRKLATDAELLKMTRCEHPLIRALALRATLERPKIDHYDLLMNHLDDTAQIAWYAQCAFEPAEYVTDYFINAFDKWKTSEEKQRTIHEVLTKHNYLRSSYTILDSLEADPKYYEVVRKLAQRQMNVPDYLEDAWIALARYKKPGDAQLLAEVMDNHWDDFGSTTFRIMKEYPDTAYLPLLENYYKRRFYRDMCERKGLQDDFLATIMLYKHPSTVRIAEHIIKTDPGKFCIATTAGDVQYSLYLNMKENNYPGYTSMLAQLQAKFAEKIRRENEAYQDMELPSLDPPPFDPADTTFSKSIGWYW